MSIEGVAARAGVGKATVYRWWSSKGVLAVEAFMEAIAPSIAFRETASARADIERQLKLLAKAYRGKAGENPQGNDWIQPERRGNERSLLCRLSKAETRGS